jgi:nucleoside-diphosphate-sugar epimerase
MRVKALLPARVQVLALTSSPMRLVEFRAQGITALVGDLDRPPTLRRLAGLASRVLHLAPPPTQGWTDPRTLALLRVLRLRSKPTCLVYGSTSGVYGDCAGDWIDETRKVHPETPRAWRRVDAEQRVRWWGRSSAVRTSVLRIPGIYAPDRDGGTPRERLMKGVPVLCAAEDVYTNHIHAHDLARACQLVLWRGAPQRIYNCNDDTTLKMGDYFDMAANRFGLPPPQRITREQATARIPAMLLSFMGESRRMVNQRIKRELGLCLRYSTVSQGLE